MYDIIVNLNYFFLQYDTSSPRKYETLFTGHKNLVCLIKFI